VEFRILGPLEVLENGHQVVRHRTRALRARPARLARFIEEQRAPPGSTGALNGYTAARPPKRKRLFACHCPGSSRMGGSRGVRDEEVGNG
jgi:hypothetical protein